jgi:RHS repeat-associated protein
MCSTSYADFSLDQETFYSYDDAGRLIREYIRDDAGRVAEHQYTWTKNGSLAQVTTPSSAVLGWTHGSAGSNSDTDRITAIWRTSTSTPVADALQWEPYGPLKQYNQQSTSGGTGLRTRITRNLAYRITAIYDNEPQTGGTAGHSVTITEDEKGRVIARDYAPSDPTLAGLYDSYFLYDQQDRVLCETTSSMASCPTSGGNIKNSHSLSPPFTAAGDWKRVLRPIPGSSGLTNSFTDVSGSHQISMVSQSDGTPTLGDTFIRYDGRGNRNLDDNQSTLTNDDRTYLYDARRNVINVRGQYKTGGAWHYYDVSSAFDAKNRRVFKQFYDETTLQAAQWFFYYDALDRLTEIRHTPDVSSPSTYSIYQLFWLGNRLVLYWQTDYPSATTSRRYVGTDESGRPIDMWSWPASGSASRVWAINPSAWGMDTNLVGPTVFQPILFAGQYQDTETIAWQNDGATPHRPGVALNGFRTYDPFTGTYLQVDPLAPATWSSYVYVESNPVGRHDRLGLMTNIMRWCNADWTTLSMDELLGCLGEDPDSGGSGGWGGGGGGGGSGGGTCYDTSCGSPTDTAVGPDWDTTGFSDPGSPWFGVTCVQGSWYNLDRCHDTDSDWSGPSDDPESEPEHSPQPSMSCAKCQSCIEFARHGGLCNCVCPEPPPPDPRCPPGQHIIEEAIQTSVGYVKIERCVPI